jgi:hypothetical protein
MDAPLAGLAMVVGLGGGELAGRYLRRPHLRSVVQSTPRLSAILLSDRWRMPVHFATPGSHRLVGWGPAFDLQGPDRASRDRHAHTAI